MSGHEEEVPVRIMFNELLKESSILPLRLWHPDIKVLLNRQKVEFSRLELLTLHLFWELEHRRRWYKSRIIVQLGVGLGNSLIIVKLLFDKRGRSLNNLSFCVWQFLNTAKCILIDSSRSCLEQDLSRGCLKRGKPKAQVRLPWKLDDLTFSFLAFVDLHLESIRFLLGSALWFARTGVNGRCFRKLGGSGGLQGPIRRIGIKRGVGWLSHVRLKKRVF